MKVKMRLIINLVTLILTATVLIFISMAWYVTNEKAEVSGVVGASAVGDNLYISSTFSPSANQTTINELDSNWKKEITIDTNSLLLPVSTNDASNYYYTPDVASDGTAIVSNNKYNFVKVTTAKSFYYLEKTIYLCLDDEKSSSCCLKYVNIKQGTDVDSNIFKAVRVYFEDEANETSKMFKYQDETAYPAISETAVANTDPAIDAGTQVPSIFNFPLVGKTINEEDVTTYTFKKIVIRIWVEGQDSNALATYAGTGFKVNLVFATYN